MKPDGASVDELSVSLSNGRDAAGNPTPSSWLRSARAHKCLGALIPGIGAARLDSQIIAVNALDSGTYHVMVETNVPSTTHRPYSLRVEAGYLSEEPRDSASNETCDRPEDRDLRRTT